MSHFLGVCKGKRRNRRVAYGICRLLWGMSPFMGYVAFHGVCRLWDLSPLWGLSLMGWSPLMGSVAYGVCCLLWGLSLMGFVAYNGFGRLWGLSQYLHNQMLRAMLLTSAYICSS